MNKSLATAAVWGLGLAQAALIIVSTVVVCLPAGRTPTTRLTIYILFFIVDASSFWHLWRGGWLTLTPAQIYRRVHHRRATTSPLETLAIVMAGAAMMTLSL